MGLYKGNLNQHMSSASHKEEEKKKGVAAHVGGGTNHFLVPRLVSAAARARSCARPVPRIASAFSAAPTASARPGLEPAPARATARRPHGRGAEVGQALKGSIQRVGSIEQTAARDVQNGVEMLDEYIAANAFAGEYVALQTGAVGFDDAKAILRAREFRQRQDDRHGVPAHEQYRHGRRRGRRRGRRLGCR